MGINTQVVSWVPGSTIIGMVVRHGEAFSITDKLSVRDAAGQTVYRPTVHYAYCPCDAAIASLWELRGNDYRLQSRQRIMTDEIISGADTLGALVMGHPLNSWWCGTSLSIEEARRRGMVSIALLGRDGGFTRGAADIELIVPGESTARIQEAQKFLLHVLCELAEEKLPRE
jgi:homospermidine synthase